MWSLAWTHTRTIWVGVLREAKETWEKWEATLCVPARRGKAEHHPAGCTAHSCSPPEWCQADLPALGLPWWRMARGPWAFFCRSQQKFWVTTKPQGCPGVSRIATPTPLCSLHVVVNFLDECQCKFAFSDKGFCKFAIFDEGLCKFAFLDEGLCKFDFLDKGLSKFGFLDKSLCKFAYMNEWLRKLNFLDECLCKARLLCNALDKLLCNCLDQLLATSYTKWQANFWPHLLHQLEALQEASSSSDNLSCSQNSTHSLNPNTPLDLKTNLIAKA